MTPPPLNIPALRSLLAAATPAPWQLGSNGTRIIQTAHITRDVWKIPKNDADLPLIVALVNAAPFLIAAAEERDRMRAVVDAARAWRDSPTDDEAARRARALDEAVIAYEKDSP